MDEETETEMVAELLDKTLITTTRVNLKLNTRTEVQKGAMKILVPEFTHRKQEEDMKLPGTRVRTGTKIQQRI